MKAKAAKGMELSWFSVSYRHGRANVTTAALAGGGESAIAKIKRRLRSARIKKAAGFSARRLP